MKKIGADAFSAAPSVTYLYCYSPKLTKRSRVENCLRGSSAATVNVLVQGKKRAKVRGAFAKPDWTGKAVTVL